MKTAKPCANCGGPKNGKGAKLCADCRVMPCEIDGCNRATRHSRLCMTHYQRKLRRGSPVVRKCKKCGCSYESATIAKGSYCEVCLISGECSIEGCRELNRYGGYCNVHYSRLKKFGATGPTGRLHARKGEGEWRIDSRGYVVRSTNGEAQIQHRYVMEQMLGRPLWPDENVHHLNGDRTDNRPENLELWSKSQPAGQRVADKVQWAIELLKRYAPERLSDAGGGFDV